MCDLPDFFQTDNKFFNFCISLWLEQNFTCLFNKIESINRTKCSLEEGQKC